MILRNAVIDSRMKVLAKMILRATANSGAWLYVCLATPSLPLAHKYAGRVGVVAYLGGVVLAVWAARRWAHRASTWSTFHAHLRWLMPATFAVLLLAFMVLYPQA